MTPSELALEVLNEPVFADAPSRGQRDYVGLIEAAYDVASDDDAWLLAVLRLVSPILDRSFGVSGHFWNFTERAAIVRHPTYVGCSPELFQAHVASGGRLTLAEADALFVGGNPCKLLGQHNRARHPRAYAAFRARVEPDSMLFISAANVARAGCAFTAPQRGGRRHRRQAPHPRQAKHARSRGAERPERGGASSAT